MEAPLALYRRYRPETFSEVIGQDHVTVPLRNALSNNRVNHAYLFSGPRGCGKTTSARILARAINCEKGPIAEPCGVCKSCTDLARGGPGSIDVIEIDAASHGGVDDARDLRERAFFSPVESRYKIYIIDEAHMVTTQGFNALLKLVEEPPPHLKFIFATTEPDKVIGTIRSRTHHYPFRLVPPKALADYMATLCEAEGVTIEPAALPLVVRAGAGSVRDSLSVLDQLIGGADADGVTYRLAVQLLGFTPDSLLDACVDGFAAHDSRAVFETIEKVIETGQDPKRFAEDLLRRLRDLVILSAVPNAVASGLIEAAEDQGERLQTQAAGIGPAELTRAADIVAAGLLEMRGATAPRLQLELICAKVLLPGADDSTNGIQARLDRMERRLTITGAAAGTTAPPAAAPQVAAPHTQTQTPPGPPSPAAQPHAASQPPAAAAAHPHPAAASQSQGAATSQPQGATASQPQGAAASQAQGAAGSQSQGAGASQSPAGAASQPQGAAASQPQGAAASQAQGGGASQSQGAAASQAQGASASQGAAGSHATASSQSPAAGPQSAGSSPAAPPAQSAPVDNTGSRSGAWGDEPTQSSSTSRSIPAPNTQPPSAPAAAAPAPTPSAGSSSGSVGLVDVRRLWPEILEAVKAKRRFAWIMLSQNAQVIAIDEQSLTLGLVNAGARESFARSGSDEILRQAMIDTIGLDRRVEAVVDPSTDPGATTAAAPPPPSSSPSSSWDSPPAAGNAPAASPTDAQRGPGTASAPPAGPAAGGAIDAHGGAAGGDRAPGTGGAPGAGGAGPGGAARAGGAGTGGARGPGGVAGAGGASGNGDFGPGGSASSGGQGGAGAQGAAVQGGGGAQGGAGGQAGTGAGGGPAAVVSAVAAAEVAAGGHTAVAVQDAPAGGGQSGLQATQQGGGPPAPAANPEQVVEERREQAASKRRAAEAAVAAEQAQRAAQAPVDEVPLTPEEEAEAIGEDDVILEEDSRSHTDLLSETLGAQIISEEPN